MKTYTLICFFLALGMILSPLYTVSKTKDILPQEIIEETSVTEAITNQPEQIPTVKVMSASSNNITEMPLKEYLIGVVAAEINPSYHEEAIKAQTIASHTLLLYVKNHKSDKLKGADISDSSATHQGYMSEADQKEKWGDSFETYHSKIAKCVDEVINQTLQYDGEYINAAFHAISNGKTENCKDVWGGSFPYLTSVPSIGDKLSPAYQSQVTVTEKEFKKKLKEHNIEFKDDAKKWIENITNTETGMVKSIQICGKTLKGTEFRTIFSLKSSTFTYKYEDEKFIFTVNGYGHGVGMSQYGANYMAQQGFTYKEILGHYYQGAEII